MKKTTQSLLALLIALCSNLPVNAQDFKVGGIYYNVISDTEKSKECEVTYSAENPYSAKVTIPETVEQNGKTYTVTRIAAYAFRNCPALTEVSVPNTVTHIGYSAFKGSKDLTTVKMSDNIKNIEVSAFQDCSNLKSINIPAKARTISNNAFAGCESLQSISLPNTLFAIESNAFEGCGSLKAVAIPYSVKKISDNPFAGCSNIEFTVTPAPQEVPDTANTYFKVDNGCLIYVYPNGKETKNLLVAANSAKSSIDVPEYVDAIGVSAFRNSARISSVNIPESVKKIGANAFANSALVSVRLKNATKDEEIKAPVAISNKAFYGCTLLASINLGNNVASIGNSAFNGCTSLKEIDIPKSMSTIGASAFEGCTSLEKVNIPATDLDKKVIVNIKSIGASAFKGCVKLVSIDMPDSTAIVSDYMFDGCESLASVELPDSAVSIGKYAFRNCKNLTAIATGKYVKTIGYGAFKNCSALSYVALGKSVKSLDDMAFAFCNNITTIRNYNSIPPTIKGKYTFALVKKGNCDLIVPKYSLEAYQKAEGWNGFKSITTPVLVLKDGETYTEKMEAEDVDVTYCRNFTNNKWQPLFIPFSLDYEDWADWAEVAEIEAVLTRDLNNNGKTDEGDETVIEFRKVKSGSLKANTPYVIRPLLADYVEKQFIGKTIKPANKKTTVDCSSAHWRYSLVGVYEPYEYMSGMYEFVDGKFMLCTNNKTLSPQRFFLEITSRDGGYGKPSAANAPSVLKIVVDGESDATGIDDVPTISSDTNAVYNLQGVRVNDNYKGIVIVNGRKVLKK